ncbi:hypothetical protein QT922_018805, partial [Xanthomonas campestris pv. campestris]
MVTLALSRSTITTLDGRNSSVIFHNVVESWVHRHWQEFERDWLNRSIDQLVFAQANLTNAEIMHIGHFDEWLETLDYWGDELFRDQIRRSTWLATYMLTNGTSPVPIIVAANSS